MSPKQVRAIGASTEAINIWGGSVSSGKTYGWLFLMLGEIKTAGPAGSLVVMGKNRDTIWRNVFEPLFTLSVFATARQHIKYRRGAPVAIIFGREVHIIGINDAGAEERIRGGTFQKVFYDEVTLCPEQVFDMLLTRMRAPGPPINPTEPRIFATTNPGGPRHYLKTRFIDRPGETNTRYLTFTMDDNPALTEAYKKRTEAAFSGMFYQRFVLGRWVAAEGAVYQSWDEDTMTVGELPRPEKLTLIATGIDYGITNPTAGHAIALSDMGVLYVVDEWAPNPEPEQRVTDTQLAESYIEWEAGLTLKYGPPQRRFADPSAVSFMEEMRQRHVPFRKASNRVIDGIARVSSLLEGGQLLVGRNNTHLLDEISEYRWDPKATERGEDKPVKENDHHCDALRYGVYSSRKLWEKRVRPAAMKNPLDM